MLKAIRKTRIYEEVVGQLSQLIDEGKLKAGDRLPSERELAETFRVSRSSVREAIKTLENERLVVTRPGSGTFLTTVNVEAIISSLASLLSRGKAALIDLFEMRCLVEPGIAALAAALRLRTVAEGVETWEEAFFLRAAGVDCGQGWFWSKAVAAPEAAKLLEKGYPLRRDRRSGSKKS